MRLYIEMNVYRKPTNTDSYIHEIHSHYELGIKVSYN